MLRESVSLSFSACSLSMGVRLFLGLPSESLRSCFAALQMSVSLVDHLRLLRWCFLLSCEMVALRLNLLQPRRQLLSLSELVSVPVLEPCSCDWRPLVRVERRGRLLAQVLVCERLEPLPDCLHVLGCSWGRGRCSCVVVLPDCDVQRRSEGVALGVSEDPAGFLAVNTSGHDEPKLNPPSRLVAKPRAHVNVAGVGARLRRLHHHHVSRLEVRPERCLERLERQVAVGVLAGIRFAVRFDALHCVLDLCDRFPGCARVSASLLRSVVPRWDCVE